MIFILWYSERTGRCILYCRSVVKLKISSAQQDTCEKIEIAHVIAALSLNAERPGAGAEPPMWPWPTAPPDVRCASPVRPATLWSHQQIFRLLSII